jgi:hypothetical protein
MVVNAVFVDVVVVVNVVEVVNPSSTLLVENKRKELEKIIPPSLSILLSSMLLQLSKLSMSSKLSTSSKSSKLSTSSKSS